MDEIDSYLKYLTPPFNMIFDFERSVKKHCLIHPEDIKQLSSISDYFDRIGRKIAVWIIPKHSLLFRNLQDVIKPNDVIKIAGSMPDAQKILSSEL